MFGLARRRRGALMVILSSVAATRVLAEPATPSKLWGAQGELFDPAGRLPDFSFAGYHRGEAPLPDVPAVASVRDYGAKGDGTTDDTAAFKRAIAEAPPGAIDIPPGRYLLTDILDITRPGVVLRGAGPDKTTLYFSKFLNDVRPNWGATTGGQRTSNYSWGGGFVWVQGQYRGAALATVAEPAKLGDTSLVVADTSKLSVGQPVEIRVDDDKEDSLASHLYAGDPGPVGELKGTTSASLVVRVTKIDGKRVTFDRPLRFDVELRWRPRLLKFEPTVSEVGIERLRFEFPPDDYQGHFTELGHNAVAFGDVADCWVRDVEIVNCDSGVCASGVFCTFDGLTYRSSRKPVAAAEKDRVTGHHGFYFYGDDNVFTRFRYDQRFIHDVTVSHAAGNVISNGSGPDLCLDHHKRTPYGNLWTNLDLGAGTRMYRSGGGNDLGKHTAARETFWNIRSRQPQSWPPAAFAPALVNLVGVATTQPSVMEAGGKWFEAIPPAKLAPQDLHEAQVKRRMGGK